MTPDEVTPRNPWPRRLIAILLVSGIACAIVALNSGNRSSTPKLPDPNGYDDLTRAGSLIHGEWPNKGDIDRADPEELRSFVSANQAALVLARVGLDRECLVHFENNQEALTRHMNETITVKTVSRLFAAEGLVAQFEGRIGDAARDFLDAMRVGQALTQGSMLTDAQLGWFLQKQSSSRLRKLRDRLSRDQLAVTLQDLESLDHRRVPVAAIVTRWESWYEGAFNPFQRTMMGWNGMDKTERANQQRRGTEARNQAGRFFSFLRIELAIHAFHEDKKTWPRTVLELVPAYLNSVPMDPTTGKAVEYPVNSEGELTDDLASIARPDGEVTSRP